MTEVCLLCKSKNPLYTERNHKKLLCENCKTVYIHCFRCAKKGEGKKKVLDFEHNDKGVYCFKCDEHFCISCWQTTGSLTMNNDLYYCEDCVKDMPNT